MARPLRLEFAGALYHVTSCGDRREAIYENDQDRENFLSVFGDICDTFNWFCHAYCLMANHYYLVVEIPDANLSRGMRQLNGVYIQRFNRLHRRVGRVLQGRYKAIYGPTPFARHIWTHSVCKTYMDPLRLQDM